MIARKTVVVRLSKEDARLLANHCRRNGLIQNDVITSALKPLIKKAASEERRRE